MISKERMRREVKTLLTEIMIRWRRVSKGKIQQTGTKKIPVKSQSAQNMGEKNDSTVNPMREHIEVTEDSLIEALKRGEEIVEFDIATDIDDCEELEHNILYVRKAGDLSPRHNNSLESKRGRSMIPLYVRTRSNKGGAISCDQ